MNLNTKITRERPELKTILLLFFRRFHVIALYFLLDRVYVVDYKPSIFHSM